MILKEFEYLLEINHLPGNYPLIRREPEKNKDQILLKKSN